MSSFSISIKKECLCVEWIRAELDWFDHKISYICLSIKRRKDYQQKKTFFRIL